MTRRRNYIDELMAEVVVYGGLIATRGEVYKDALACTRDWMTADRYAMRAPIANPDDIACRQTLAAMRQYEANQPAQEEKK